MAKKQSKKISNKKDNIKKFSNRPIHKPQSSEKNDIKKPEKR